MLLLAEFLNNGQTFLGTIASLLVLCLVAKNNMILDILKHVLVGFENIENKYLNNPCRQTYNEIKKSREYKKLQTKVLKIRTKPKYMNLNSQERKILRANDNLQDILSEIEVRISPLKDTPTLLGSSCVIPLSPMYALLYTIVLFIMDEAMRIRSGYADLMISFIVIFTAMSALFWLVIWAKYVILWRKKSTFAEALPQQSADALSLLYESIRQYKCWLFTLFVILMCWIVLSILIVIISNYTADYIDKRLMVWGVAIFIPFGAFGVIKEVSYSRRKVYEDSKDPKLDYSRLIGHFALFLVISLAIAFLEWKSCDHGILYEYQGFNKAKFMVLAYVLVFGLILPFIVPWICYTYRSDKFNKIYQEDMSEARALLIMAQNELSKAIALF